MNCEELLRELSNYIDQAVSPDLFLKMQAHFRACESCAATLETTLSVVQALNDDQLMNVPPGYSARLYKKLQSQIGSSAFALPIQSERQIPLGITADLVNLGFALDLLLGERLGIRTRCSLPRTGSHRQRPLPSFWSR